MKTTIIIKFLDGTSKEIEHGDYLSIIERLKRGYKPLLLIILSTI